MYPQVSSLGESLFTMRAGVELLSIVYSTVFAHGARVREGFVTGGAGEWLISCVCYLVSLQATRPRKSLVTLRAGIRSLSGVNSHVNHQVF